jgi:hypothetical protein
LPPQPMCPAPRRGGRLHGVRALGCHLRPSLLDAGWCTGLDLPSGFLCRGLFEGWAREKCAH